MTALTVDAKQDRLWRSAALAALGLTTHEPGLRRLTGPSSWTAAQDVVATLPRPLVIRTAADLPDAARRITPPSPRREGRPARLTIVAATLAHGVSLAADLLQDAGRVTGHTELSTEVTQGRQVRPGLTVIEFLPAICGLPASA